MKLKIVTALFLLFSLGSHVAAADQFYLEDTSTLHDEGDEAQEGSSCNQLVLQIERNLQEKADLQCGLRASRKSDWDIECFRPSMNERALSYVFAKVGASFGCFPGMPNFAFVGDENVSESIAPIALAAMDTEGDGFTGTKCRKTGGHLGHTTCCKYKNGRRLSCTTEY